MRIAAAPPVIGEARCVTLGTGRKSIDFDHEYEHPRSSRRRPRFGEAGAEAPRPPNATGSGAGAGIMPQKTRLGPAPCAPTAPRPRRSSRRGCSRPGPSRSRGALLQVGGLGIDTLRLKGVAEVSLAPGLDAPLHGGALQELGPGALARSRGGCGRLQPTKPEEEVAGLDHAADAVGRFATGTGVLGCAAASSSATAQSLPARARLLRRPGPGRAADRDRGRGRRRDARAEGPVARRRDRPWP